MCCLRRTFFFYEIVAMKEKPYLGYKLETVT